MTNEELKNSTIAMLDRHEIGFFKLFEQGVYTYKGTLKSRRAGFKTEKVNEYQTNFTNAFGDRIEFIKIKSSGLGVDEYAMRIFNTDENCYYKDYPILTGIDFFK